ncbi:Polysaccharide pyruvyl transferase [Lachnospiraceae bacterium]|nr:Polysaccharide pyruvyl transferase [Lachnospiraceae bacterium]
MRVGILTFQNAYNYGAVLQAFALKEAISSLGAEVEVINYDSPYMQLKKFQTEEFRLFSQNYLNLTDEYTDKKQIEYQKYDLIIAGSDQVWNPGITRGDTAYFLDFTDDSVYRASYSASIALGLDALKDRNIQNWYKDNLMNIQSVSIRESIHYDFVSSIVPNDRMIVTSVDPSLLLSDKDYVNKLQLDDVKMDDYIFVFSYQPKMGLIDKANMLSMYYNLPIIAFLLNYPEEYLLEGSIMMKSIEVTDWIQLVRNAKMVLTDSFHGMMYSIVFRKPFYQYCSNQSVSSRITGALNQFHLEDRNLNNVMYPEQVKFEIDYTEAELVLERERKKSFDYLTGVLEKAKRKK